MNTFLFVIPVVLRVGIPTVPRVGSVRDRSCPSRGERLGSQQSLALGAIGIPVVPRVGSVCTVIASIESSTLQNTVL